MDPAWIDAVVLLVTGPSFCSGTLVEPAGTVATAYHCVANGQRPLVRFHDGTEARGRTVAVDVEQDLALVTVDGEAVLGRPTRPIRPERPTIGERVYGIGHPYAPAATGRLEGTLLWSVSEGVVAAVGERVIQTDAALNPGNSGGPLLDADGAIVGVVSLKLAADNLAFASRASLLADLLSRERRFGAVGGTWSLGGVLLPTGGDLGVVGEFELVDRDRVWLRLQAGAEAGELPRPISGLGLGLRQRLGRGQVSTAADLGVSLLVTGASENSPAQESDAGSAPLFTAANTAFSPWVNARFTLAGVGLGAAWRPTDNAWGVELSTRVAAVHGVW